MERHATKSALRDLSRSLSDLSEVYSSLGTDELDAMFNSGGSSTNLHVESDTEKLLTKNKKSSSKEQIIHTEPKEKLLHIGSDTSKLLPKDRKISAPARRGDDLEKQLHLKVMSEKNRRHSVLGVDDSAVAAAHRHRAMQDYEAQTTEARYFPSKISIPRSVVSYISDREMVKCVVWDWVNCDVTSIVLLVFETYNYV